MGRYLLSIDNGLTTTKAVLFTPEGLEVASSLCKTKIVQEGRFAEIDMALQWENTVKAIRQLLESSGINSGDIIGIGNSGHGAGLYMVDAKGNPLGRAISSMDSRAFDIVDAWEAEGRNCTDKIFHKPWGGQPIPILYWLKTNKPEVYSKICKIISAKDWIRYKLTGCLATEYTDASNSGLINLTSGRSDPDLFSLFDAEEAANTVPELLKCTDQAGVVCREAAKETGLLEGTPVIGGLFDVVACSLGSGVYGKDKYSVIAGTWNVNSGVEESARFLSDTIKCSYYVETDKFIYVESSATSTVNLEWFIRNVIREFGGGFESNRDLYGHLDEAVLNIKPEDSEILYFPFIHKSFLSKNMDGAFFGIRSDHNGKHMLRAVYEGVAFAHRRHVENLKKAGILRNTAVLSGGASGSPVWQRIFSDVMGIDVATTESSQVGALGTAICTAVATGVYGCFEDAISVMVTEKNRCTPDSGNHRIYSDKYSRFVKIVEGFEKITF